MRLLWGIETRELAGAGIGFDIGRHEDVGSLIAIHFGNHHRKKIQGDNEKGEDASKTPGEIRIGGWRAAHHPSFRAVFVRNRDRVSLINSGAQFARSNVNAVLWWS